MKCEKCNSLNLKYEVLSMLGTIWITCERCGCSKSVYKNVTLSNDPWKK